jgi:uncharacterized protein (UPF0548 family)
MFRVSRESSRATRVLFLERSVAIGVGDRGVGLSAALVGWSCCRHSGIRFHHHGGARNLAVGAEWLHMQCQCMYSIIMLSSCMMITKRSKVSTTKSMALHNHRRSALATQYHH